MSAPYYADDHVTLYHGDCLEVTEWLAADVLVTDPPYGSDETAPFATTHEEVYVLGNGWLPGRRPTVLRYPNLLGARRPDHPTPKPVGLMEWVILCAPDGTVADPFAGSGSTLVAARNLGRRAIGVELEERYCEVIAKRLAQDVLDFGDAS